MAAKLPNLRELAHEHSCQLRWAGVLGYEGLYRVSDCGDVLSLRRKSWRLHRNGKPNQTEYPEKLLRPKIHSAGYQCVELFSSGKGRWFSVHRLVAAAFVPGTGDVVRHLDGNPANNNANNLAWGSYTDNEADKRQHGRVPLGEKHKNSVLTESGVREIRAAISAGYTDLQLSRKYGVARYTIYSIKRGLTWAHVT